ncbi:unnamed protein product [Sphagnum jensenii]|jgi:DNA polymerase epsilon subunit 4|uniref:Transcription factor CBF/NF-Y/archaeal histone domain-containing protein n=1 Tax=Sphagnum jensenii TaxID=128206 RepID=A0ABP0WM40_9BRYO
METSFTESDSEESGRELPSSAAAEEEEEEEEKTENGGYSHEENGNSNSNDDDGDGDDGTTTMSRSFVVGGGRTSKSASVFSLAFPISRVRKLVKSDGDIQWVGVEAGFLIAKAAELFLEKFVEDAFDRMQESHRNSITYSDLSSHVVSTERLEFLSDFVPEKVLVSSILPSKALMEN